MDDLPVLAVEEVGGDEELALRHAELGARVDVLADVFAGPAQHYRRIIAEESPNLADKYSRDLALRRLSLMVDRTSSRATFGTMPGLIAFATSQSSSPEADPTC